MQPTIAVAYFSMEIGLKSEIPTYAGGLGILAGDTVRSAADLGLPFVAVTILPRKGYFYQCIDPTGWQTEQPVHWAIEDYLTDTGTIITITIEQRPVKVKAWRYDVTGATGAKVPVYFLDTDIDGNSSFDRTLSHYLYGGDNYYRLCQEAVLGIGGVRILRALGYLTIHRFHMNEGHASLLVTELINEISDATDNKMSLDEILKQIHSMCIFTTHTPVPAGHDKFPLDMAQQVLGDHVPFCDLSADFCLDHELNMTYLALKYSRYVNGVAKRHREVSQQMFSGYDIESITNGVHLATWISDPFKNLLDASIRDWHTDNASLRYALGLDLNSIWHAHEQCKADLIQYINRETNAGFDMAHFTMGYARRATPYKRADLIFNDVKRLVALAEKYPLQIVFAGKAHPHDQKGKEIIQHIYRVKEQLKGLVKIVFLPEYTMRMAKRLVSGSDIWLNTPMPPMEASGTSGMKAAINAVPSLSVLDGWWIEGCIEGVTGWSFDSQEKTKPNTREDAESLYTKLDTTILPMFYQQREEYIKVMRSALAINGSFFNTERMLNQYISKAYFLD